MAGDGTNRVNTEELLRGAQCPQHLEIRKLLEEAADQIQNQTVKVMNAANEAMAASWSGKAGGIFVKFMQEQSKALSSEVASLKEIAAFLQDA